MEADGVSYRGIEKDISLDSGTGKKKGASMITTREINVNLDKGQTKLKQVSTKTIDASIKVEQPKEPIKAQGISTTTLADVADIAEKKRRDDIAAERNSFQKNMAIYQVEQNELIAKEKKLAMKEKMAKVRTAKKGKKK